MKRIRLVFAIVCVAAVLAGCGHGDLAGELWIAAASSDRQPGELRIVEAGSGDELVAGSPGDPVEQVAWSPQGDRVASVANGVLRVVQVENGDVVEAAVVDDAILVGRLPNPEGGPPIAPWSPNGEHLAVEGSRLVIFDRDAEEVATFDDFVIEAGRTGATQWSPGSSRLAGVTEDRVIVLGIDGSAWDTTVPVNNPDVELSIYRWTSDSEVLVHERTSGPQVTIRHTLLLRDGEFVVTGSEVIPQDDPSLWVAYDISGVCDFQRLDGALRDGEAPVHGGLTADGRGCFQLLQGGSSPRIIAYRAGDLWTHALDDFDAPPGAHPVDVRLGDE